MAYLPVSLLALGCYTYHPVGQADLRPEMPVRAHLSPSQAAELAEYLPSEADRLIEGTVVENGRDELMLLVPVTTANVRGVREKLNQRLGIPFDGIVEIEHKELDRGKTAVISVGGVILTGLFLFETLGPGFGGGNSGSEGPRPEDSIILIRIPIG
jgi:hypothetical protein